MSNVRVVKLITGEEIVTDVAEDTEFLYIENTLLLLLQQVDNGSFKMGFAPYGNSVDGQIKISKAHVLYNEKPNEQLLNMYNQVFGGIVTPPKGIVLPR